PSSDRHPLIVPTGLNAALIQTRDEVIVRVDGHIEIDPDYVRQCVAALRRSGADNVGGRMHAIGAGAFGEAVALATSMPFGVGNARFHYSDREEWVDTVSIWAHGRVRSSRVWVCSTRNSSRIRMTNSTTACSNTEGESAEPEDPLTLHDAQ